MKFNNNSAAGPGGAILVETSLELIGSIGFTNNKANAGDGGAINSPRTAS